ncbi:MAG TPA: hypothetical protein VME42_01080 [Steroidobacteraceae bacterium]|nr:hypothetical protein [Steroidobacteraceae bacterium]
MLLVNAIDRLALCMLLDRFGLELVLAAPGQVIPGSYWGEREAGLIGSRIHARLDTPLHSVLHESAHFICMTPERRAGLDTDAGGDDAEESAVCYLQILLARELPHVGAQRICRDMDDWGYSFRLGSASRWFAEDAEDAREWLLRRRLIDSQGGVAYRVRDSSGDAAE